MDNEIFHSFTELFSDLQILIINKFVAPEVSLLFLSVSKFFNSRLNRDMIIYRYLKKKSYDNWFVFVRGSIHCEICYMVTNSSNTMKIHMEKHKKNPNKKLQKHKKPESCELCDVPYVSNKHKCLLRTKDCPRKYFAHYYGWIEVLCNKPTIYEIETHMCGYRCRECKEEFHDHNENIGGSITRHFHTCKNKLNMVSKYGIRKEKITIKFDQNFGNYENANWVCYYCDKDKYNCYSKDATPDEEKCSCVCKICERRGSNKVITETETYYICENCAKCAKCGSNWNESGHDKIWHYESLPYCEKCVKDV